MNHRRNTVRFLCRSIAILALTGSLSSLAHSQSEIQLSIACSSLPGLEGQARVDDPHTIWLTVKGPVWEEYPFRTVFVTVPSNMTAEVAAQKVLEALEDKGVPGATEGPDPTANTDIDKAARRIIRLPPGWHYRHDRVLKHLPSGPRVTESHLKVEPVKSSPPGSNLNWIRLVAFEEPVHPVEVHLELSNSDKGTVFHFEQSFPGGVVAGFDGLQTALLAQGMEAIRASTWELFIHVGGAPTGVDRVVFGVSEALDTEIELPPETEVLSIRKEIEVL